MEAKSRLCKRNNKGSIAQNKKRQILSMQSNQKHGTSAQCNNSRSVSGILLVTDHTYIFSIHSENKP